MTINLITVLGFALICVSLLSKNAYAIDIKKLIEAIGNNDEDSVQELISSELLKNNYSKKLIPKLRCHCCRHKPYSRQRTTLPLKKILHPSLIIPAEKYPIKGPWGDSSPNLTPLQIAAQYSSSTIVQTLINCGVSVHDSSIPPDLKDVHLCHSWNCWCSNHTEKSTCLRYSTIYLACASGNADAFKTLLDNGANFMIAIYGGSGNFMHLAVEKNYCGILKLLINKSPSLCTVYNQDGVTPIHMAARLNRFSAIVLFLNNPQCYNGLFKEDQNGVLPLEAAISSKSEETSGILGVVHLCHGYSIYNKFKPNTPFSLQLWAVYKIAKYYNIEHLGAYLPAHLVRWVSGINVAK